MVIESLHKHAHLTLDELTPDPGLARRLPVDLARRYHALPLAEDSGRVTVAMADPDDAAARDAIAQILGPALYVVQANSSTIDTLVAELWGEEGRPPLGLVVCDIPDLVRPEVWNYAQMLAELLGARLSRIGAPEHLSALALEEAASGCDLAICEEPSHPVIRSLLALSRQRREASGRQSMPLALAAVRQPCWPLKKILLILCGEEGDIAAAEWVLHLARSSGGVVTVLAVVPPVPDSAEPQTSMNQGLPGLLSSDTRLGRQMQAVGRHLINSKIVGTLRLRQGPPEWQIERELMESDYDLVALAGQFCRRLRHRPEADLSESVPGWTNQTVLEVNPAASQGNP